MAETFAIAIARFREPLLLVLDISGNFDEQLREACLLLVIYSVVV